MMLISFTVLTLMLFSGCKSQYFLDFHNAYIKYPSNLFTQEIFRWERNITKTEPTTTDESDKTDPTEKAESEGDTKKDESEKTEPSTETPKTEDDTEKNESDKTEPSTEKPTTEDDTKKEGENGKTTSNEEHKSDGSPKRSESGETKPDKTQSKEEPQETTEKPTSDETPKSKEQTETQQLDYDHTMTQPYTDEALIFTTPEPVSPAIKDKLKMKPAYLKEYDENNPLSYCPHTSVCKDYKGNLVYPSGGHPGLRSTLPNGATNKPQQHIYRRFLRSTTTQNLFQKIKPIPNDLANKILNDLLGTQNTYA